MGKIFDDEIEKAERVDPNPGSYMISIDAYKELYEESIGKELKEPIIIDNPVVYFKGIPVYATLHDHESLYGHLKGLENEQN